MKVKNIFKTLAFAMLMPAMLLTTACIDNELPREASHEIPVTVNVTRQSNPDTRATYNESTRKLSFSAGDKLLVRGNDNSVGGAGRFAGMLDYDASEGNFSGTIYTENSYSGTADALFTAATANWVGAALFPNGYDTYEFLSLSGSGCSTSYSMSYNKAIAATKAAAVEQFSLETAKTYSSGFALSPENAILNFTIAGLTDGAKDVTLMNGSKTMFTGSVTPTSGTAAFALGARIKDNSDWPVNLKNVILTIGDADIDITDANNNLAAGKIYNITRSAAPAPAATDLSTINADYTASDGETLTGTLGADVKISIADGATVTLNNVTINGTNDDYEWAGITCVGDATIILSGTNTVKGFYEDYPGIYVPVGNTVTIKGSGSLTASSNGYGAGIGGGFGISCGNIEIQGGVITATGGWSGAGIGAGSGVGTGESICGTITISGGTVTATGGWSGAGIGSGYAQTNPSTCGAISISGGTVSATAGAHAPAAIGKGAVDVGESTCASVTITPDITSLTLTNTNSGVTGIVSDFINATAVNANTTPITTMLSTSVTDPAITGGMATAGFATLYDGDAKTWTITKK